MDHSAIGISLQGLASALGGEVSAGQVLAPGPGHSPADRSMSVKLDDGAPDGFIVHSFADQDPIACKDYVRDRLGLAEWQPNGKDGTSGGVTSGPPSPGKKIAQAMAGLRKPQPERKWVADYDYRDLDGKLLYQVQRFDPKAFIQRRPAEGGGWIYKDVFEGISRAPYRWPELAAELAAYPDAPIFCTEGEKDCDNVRSLGLFATTAAGSMWTPEIAAVLKGRDIVYLEHNDQAGREKSAKAGRALHGIAASVRIARFTDLPERGDVSDWIANDPGQHDADALGRRCVVAPLFDPMAVTTPAEQVAGEPPPQPLQWLNMSNWDSEPVPEQDWAVLDRIPLRQCVLYSGEGAVGKSIELQHLCAAHTLARDWLGSMPEPGPAFYIEAEDEASVLHRRLAAILAHYNATFADAVAGGLKLMSLAGQDAILATVARNGRIEPTTFYTQLLEAAGDLKPKMIGIASSANVYAGSEIDRAQVQQFVGMLTRIAIVANGTVVLASHPSLTGITSDSGISGTTQWHNAVRARFYMKSIKPEAGEQPDNDLREIVFKKNQYGPVSASIIVRYQSGLFLPVPGMASLERAARDAKAEEIFLDLLQRFTGDNRRLSDRRSPTYAPAILARESIASKAGITANDLAAAMRRLFEAKKIWNEPCGKASRPSFRLARRDQ